MSQVKIQGGASGSDNYTILAPATSTGDKTLTLPTATATLASTDANTFTGVQTFPAGSVSAPSITTTGDTNTGVFFPAADTAAIATGGSERMRVDSSGNIQIATTSNPLLWYNSTTTGNRFRIEQNGTPSADAYVTQGLVRNSSEDEGAMIGFAKSRGTTAGSATIVNNNDYFGLISFQGADGTNYVEGVRIGAFVDGTPGANDMPGRLVFFTTADGAATPTERARITSGGNLLVGTTTNNASGGVIQVSNGITFPATQSASSDANTLDDYEEGTWTPSLTSSSGSLTTVSNGTGNYTKIGNCVTVTCAPSITTNGTGSGRLIISGLPFARGKNQLTGASREDGVVGFVFGISEETTTSIGLQKYDATYPGGNGYRFAISITYLI